MPEKPVHNLTMLMTGPNGSQTLVSLTIPEPGALRLYTQLVGISPQSTSEAIKQALKMGVNEIDRVVCNEPEPVASGEHLDTWPGQSTEAKRLGVDHPEKRDGSVSGEKHKGKGHAEDHKGHGRSAHKS